jgi:hypothetical protein
MNRTTRRGVPPLLVLACLVAGCGGADETRLAKWSYISTAIVQPNCATANCHSVLSMRSGVQLDGIRTGYTQLVGRYFVLGCSADRTKPCEVPLLALIKGQGSRRMPPDFALPKADIDLIEDWIRAGAPYDGPGSAPAVTVTVGN